MLTKLACSGSLRLGAELQNAARPERIVLRKIFSPGLPLATPHEQMYQCYGFSGDKNIDHQPCKRERIINHAGTSVQHDLSGCRIGLSIHISSVPNRSSGWLSGTVESVYGIDICVGGRRAKVGYGWLQLTV